MFSARRLEMLVALGFVSFFIGALGLHASAQPVVAKASEYKTPQEADPYVRFDMEAYDSIRSNFWKKATDSDMANLFMLSLQKASGSSTPLVTADRAGTAQMMATALAPLDTAAKKNLTLTLLQVALYNLPPNGRNQLLSAKQETALRQEVSNINPNKDLYADLGAKSGATKDEVQSAYDAKKEALAASSSPEAKQQLAQAKYAYEVLTKPETKDRYDKAKIEPTVFTHVLGKTLYINISQMAPTTFDEFVSAINSASSTPGLDSLIIDLRGNIGGALDIAPYVVGLWVGPNQYVFDLYHQDDYQAIRSPQQKLDGLKRLRDVAVLTDNMTQSTAELIAAALKRYHIAYTVGQTSRGWGTVENTFGINTSIDPSETYALLLVHSLTLRDDEQPIEGAGVSPDVSTTDAAWRSQLPTFFRSSSIVSALKEEAMRAPLK